MTMKSQAKKKHLRYIYIYISCKVIISRIYTELLQINFKIPKQQKVVFAKYWTVCKRYMNVKKLICP